MSTPTASADSTASRRPRIAFAAGLGCSALLAAAAAALAPAGSAAGLVAAAAAGVVLGGAWMARSVGPQAPDEEAGDAGRSLVAQVIPVWQRTAELARSTAERDAAALTERFANVHAQLNVALDATSDAPTLDGAAIDDLLERHRGEIDSLRADAREALDALAAVLDVAQAVERGADKLTHLVGDMHRISRATHMLGLNASVEATRSAGSHATFEVVATDVRALAGQSQAAAERMASEVTRIRDHVQKLRALRQGVSKDDEDLSLRSEINARAVLRALLSSLGESARNSHVLRDAGQQAQAEIEAILMGLQGHDRINQMLQSVIGDLGLMRETLADPAACGAASAGEWLSRLESSYTMEEMRTSHHGTKSFETQAAVEFF